MQLKASCTAIDSGRKGVVIIMKSKIIKRIAGLCSIGLAGILIFFAVQDAVLTASAEETLFGIETLVQQVQTREQPYTILEIVPDEAAAEIGYLLPGYEPAISQRQENGEWYSWEQGLGQLTTAQERSQYMTELSDKLQSFFQSRGLSGDNVPVSYLGYEESTEPREGFTELAFAAQERKGYFQTYRGGEPRYDLSFVYMGDRTDSDVTGNITAQYYYAEIATQITQGMLSTLQEDAVLFRFVNADNAPRFERAGTWGELKDSVTITVSDGDAGDTVTGGDAGDTDPDQDDDPILTDYYLVNFAPWQETMDATTYTALYAVGGMTESANGAYEFAESEDGYPYTFTTDAVYYKGGFVNNEWFRGKVINLEPEQMESFPVKVITLTAAELNSMDIIPAFDCLYLNSGISAGVAYAADNDISSSKRNELFAATVAEGRPCILDASILYRNEGAVPVVNASLQNTNIFYLCAMFQQKSPVEFYESRFIGSIDNVTVEELLEGAVEDGDRNFVTEQTYSFLTPATLINDNFSVPDIYREGQNIKEGFTAVLDEIISENLNREADTSGSYKPLSTDISQATVIRHIINYQNRRQIEVKKNIRILEIEPCMSDAGSYDLTEAEVLSWAPEVEKIEIVRMTTAEFIGRIEDINEEYDLIYIGTDRDHMNVSTDENHQKVSGVGSTVFNDSSMDGLIYYHTGDLRYAGMELAGQLDTEYVDGAARQGNVYYYNPVRYGGNDITLEKKEALLSFLDASYPIIVSDEFFESAATVYTDSDYRGYSADLEPGSYNMNDLIQMGISNDSISSIKVRSGYRVVLYWDSDFGGSSVALTADTTLLGEYNGANWNDAVSSMVVEEIEGASRTRQINGDHIDNSSYLYDFVKEAMGRTNFYARDDIGQDSGMFKFYLNRPKANLTNVTANGTLNSNGIYEIYPTEDGRYVLEYKFTIVNEGAASADTRYRCQLYIDVNADGKYSGNEELGDITLTQNGNAVSADNLYAGREYVLRRYVPDGYKGVLPWKIQISQVNNSNIHNGITGYTKLRGLERETLKVLQICRDKILDPAWWGGANEVLFNLEARIADPTDMYHVLIYGGTYDGVYYEGIYQDFDIDVNFMTISTFEEAFAENENILDDYNMLILGFSDAYGNMSGDKTSGPIGAIVNFIQSGKSVLFAHDTVTYFNYSPEKQGISNRYTGAIKTTDQYHNSYSLTQNIRGLVGMDLYGITSYDRLKTGTGLSAGTAEWNTLLGLGKDIAYVPKSGKTASYGLTQGYTYSIINSKDKFGSTGDTFYPEETGLAENFTNDFLNLKFGTVYYFDNSDQGEVPANYNGETSNLYVTKVNSGQITDYPYKLADEFQVSTTHGQYYQLDFMADDDHDGQSDLVVWYCLGYRRNGAGERQNTIYSVSPNDVSNNYYIYNKGNITYTGMGHAGNTSTVEEAKLFINTIIASYNAGVKDPVITTLSDGTGNAREISSVYSYYDEANELLFREAGIEQSEDQRYEKVYFSVNDLNFVKGTRKIAVNCYYEDSGEGSLAISYEGKQVSVKPLPVQIYNASNNEPVADSNSLVSGGVYYILFDKALMGDYSSRFSVYFEAQSTINTYTNEIKTGKVYRRFDFTKVYLFDLK